MRTFTHYTIYINIIHDPNKKRLSIDRKLGTTYDLYDVFSLTLPYDCVVIGFLAYYEIIISIREEVVITRAGVGHTQSAHSYIINKEPKLTYETCRFNLPIHHIMIDFPKFSESRRILGNPSSIRETLDEDQCHMQFFP